MKKKTNPLWGGRFEKESSALLKRINNSISFDYKLASQDLRVSNAYCEALFDAKIINKNDRDLILKGLKEIEKEITNKRFIFKDDFWSNLNGFCLLCSFPILVEWIDQIRNRSVHTICNFPRLFSPLPHFCD